MSPQMYAQALLACVTLILGVHASAMTVAFFRLRRRHRALRHTLSRVAAHRDGLIWEKQDAARRG